MQAIYIVRHGDYENPRNIMPGKLPLELSKKGIGQSEKIMSFFKDKKISKIYSSPVLRCHQTSKIIADNKIPIVPDKRLVEVVSACQGYWEMVNAYALVDKYGGESAKDVQDRMVNFFDEIVASKEDIIICSHGDPIYFLLCHLLKEPLPLPDEEPDYSLELYPKKGSMIKLSQKNDKYVIEAIKL